MLRTAFFIMAFILFGFLSYGGWLLSKKINYTFSYQSQVIKEICANINPEALRNPDVCK